MTAIDMSKIYSNKNYKGKWVAIINYNTYPKVVASGKTLDETLKKSEEKGFKNPVVSQIPKKLMYFVGICQSK